ncbi:X-linked retinitis pigmentosa GTPase regulator-like isoform X2 [Acanthaster planci]|uniref:X-linked retinitis pigmentosa GTPase regulator-like isoform X2 n=1 Tax=Acanthaster planci TaxID=133434 RepID=A0A8B7ZL42_ACAPL|nr:X-linked retinitis pigmentosa GTPase regulator-like isoform X2 [Acanthaster planci]
MDTKRTIEDNSLLQSATSDDATSSEHPGDSLVANGQRIQTDTSKMGTDDGHILSWGCGEFGQHGHGHMDNVSPDGSLLKHFYEQIAKMAGTREGLPRGGTVPRLKTFACGASHTIVVTASDQVYSWGNSNSGQLGCGDKETHLTPQRVRLPGEAKASPIKGLACGSRHSVLWLENGLCFSWGNNFYAQLAYDFRIENYKDNQVLPHLLRPIAHLKVTQVACGEKHSLFLYETSIVAACGCGNFGQLGSGNRAELVSPKVLELPEGVAFIACGANHSLAVTATGELYTWGFGRACGRRREDILQPARIMTRQSNVIAATGGSAHSVALTANGTVYTWGGGTEGQLGHGSKVLYLGEPRPLSHDALPRVSQIACGDSYSAAVTPNGTLYMWGKNSHVIPTSDKPKPYCQQPTPMKVSPGGQPVARVACGSWHAMAVVGTPEWQPLQEDSEEELDPNISIGMWGDGDFSDSMEVGEGKDMTPEDASNCGSAFQEQPGLSDQQTHPVQREATKLTLAEFYAPTPLPAISVPEDYSDEMDSELDTEKTDPKVDEVYQGEQAVLNSEGTMLELDSQAVDEAVEEEGIPAELDSVDKSLTTRFFVDISGTSVEQRTLKNEVLETERSNIVKGGVSTRSKQHQSQPQESTMVRSKTMPVVTRKPLKMASASTTAAFNWSDPPKSSPETEPTSSRFVIHKHVSVQLNRKGDGSSDRTRGRKPIAQVGLHGSGEGDALLSRSKERNVMPPPPNFNRAKTYYGRMSQKRPEAEPRLSQFLSSLPPAPSQTSSAPTKLQARKRLDKPTGPSDRSPNWVKPHLLLVSTSAEGRGQIPGKPVFSSAASWRTRSSEEDIL